VTKDHIIQRLPLMFLATRHTVSPQAINRQIQTGIVVAGRKSITVACLTLVALTLGGCDWVVMAPSGDIAVQQRNLILISTGLMLLIIVPVMAATLWFAWKYRSSNTEAVYTPDWDHSARLEVLIWSAPLAIIIVLGAITWISTHKLDPYRPLDRIDAARTIPEGTKPLTVEVVAMDWKWMFLYPDYGVATINELAAPVDRPITFHITASSVMNSFYIPALAGQVYAMTGMQTKLHAVINKEGDYEGFSANYSGPGFSHMRFGFKGLSPQAFDAWIAKVKSTGEPLGRTEYLKFEKPTHKEPVRYFKDVDPKLYAAILNMCVDPAKMCMKDMMHIDMMGGGGKESHANREKLEYDNRHNGTWPLAGHEEGETHSDKTDTPEGSKDTAPEAEPQPHQH
jgi:cytochrome o ubiquinol oxidase subunit 2